ncbi:PREDICTED: testis-specific serine kinase substrate [Myotis davidii]|uniref:testis-specific serine kinase substrate n=1 Tax=Myotis davidii TaxID=225400 RepID=UPI0007672E88|nr:PREDICTED: testis-specific serine kinase substrate [Myotis davidii]
MASVVVKTIWQSKEIHEAGDPPAGVESRSQMIPEAPGGVTSPTKGISKKKKAVSFHGVEPRMSHEPMHWCLNLKRSSACTNVSLLNLAAVEATDSSVTDSTTEDSSSLALPVAPTSPTPPWTPDDPDITELLSGVNSGLVRAKDSITSLKEKTTRVNQHVQTLQVCGPPCPPTPPLPPGRLALLGPSTSSVSPWPSWKARGSERKVVFPGLASPHHGGGDQRQGADTGCGGQGGGVPCHLGCHLYGNRGEGQGGRTGMGRQGPCPGVLTQENCRKVTRSVEDAEIKTNVLKQNSALLEEKLRYLQQQLQDETPRRQEAQLQELEQKLEAGLSRQGCSGPPGRAPGARAGEGLVMSEQEVQKVSAGLEDLRREVSSLTGPIRAERGRQGGVCALLVTGTASLGGAPSKPWLLFRFRVERSAVSVASLRSDLEGLGPVKPILEELGRQFQSSRRSSDISMSLERAPQGSCTRCASQGQQLSTESLQQLLERALTPLVDEVKQRGLAPACPSCQRLHKKILELERQALAKHVRAEALSSTLRLAQDEALRAKNLLLTDKMKPEEKVASLDYLHLKMCSLHDQLSNLPLEGSTGTMGGGSSGGAPPKRGGSNPEQ